MNESATIRCLVVDDEPPAREVLRRYIESMPTLELAGECASAVEALAYLQQHPVDLLFLDIRMPRLNGNELMRILKNPPKVIFTTAHVEYALEGYELDVIDYLLKPVSFERFVKAVHKANHLVVPNLPETPASPATHERFVYFRSDRKMVKVLLDDIEYIESMKDYIKVVTGTGVIVTKQAISAVEEMLPEHLFLRCHRSFIVSLARVRAFTPELISVGKTEIPIGKLFRQDALRRLGTGLRTA